MALDDPVVAQLADRYSIATEFWDWKGHHTQVDAATVVAVLAALGVDAHDACAARRALADADLAPWRRMMAPVVVTQAGQAASVTVHVAAGHPAHLRVRLERGGERAASQVDNWEPDREVDGQLIGEATFRLPADLPCGYHHLIADSDDRSATSTLIVTPAFVGFPPAMGDDRVWGYQAQLYSARSTDSWGIGDLTDLADLATWSASQGAGYLLINPLHAAQPAPPVEPSPYLPTSRRFVNPLYVRPGDIDEYVALSEADRRRIDELRADLDATLSQLDAAQPVDESGVTVRLHRNEAMAAKLAALRIIYRAPRRAARTIAYREFTRRSGQPLDDFATWCALSVHFGGQPWSHWPAPYRDPRSAEVTQFRSDHADEVDFYRWLQWVCDLQLSKAQAAAKDAGMPVGIVADLAVGVNAYGADTWSLGDVYATDMRVGAPPDAYNQLGQEWGQPPWRPDKLEEVAYRPFRDLVAATLRHAGGVRIDHIIGLFRLWWVPAGQPPTHGTYVRYNHEALVGILALEAARAGALVIGEDLGTVEPWVRDYLRSRGILGTSVLWFSRDEHGHPLEANRWPEYTMASVVTHDLPPTAGYLAGDHITLRHRLGLLSEPLDVEQRHDQRDKHEWVARLVDDGLLDSRFANPSDADANRLDTTALTAALHRYLVTTPARVLNVALVDAVGERRTQNQPGTLDEYPNWRVPLAGPDGRPITLDQVFTAPGGATIAAIVNRIHPTPDHP